MDISSMTIAELLRLQAEARAELRRRRVVRTANAPAGDFAELLVARATRGTLAEPSQKG
jgi:hypothetical protein